MELLKRRLEIHDPLIYAMNFLTGMNLDMTKPTFRIKKQKGGGGHPVDPMVKAIYNTGGDGVHPGWEKKIPLKVN